MVAATPSNWAESVRPTRCCVARPLGALSLPVLSLINALRINRDGGKAAAASMEEESSKVATRGVCSGGGDAEELGRILMA